MNIAFSAVVLSFLAVPGFLFWWGYSLQERVNVGTQWETTFSLVVKGLVTSAFLHAFWIILSNCLFASYGVHVDIKAALALAAAAYGGTQSYFELFDRSLNAVADHPIQVTLYFLSLYIASLFFGIFLRWLVVHLRFDNRMSISILSYCQWYKLFDEHKRQRAPPGTRGMVHIGATVTQGNDTYVYRGLLDRYLLSDNKELKQLILTVASRRALADDAPPTTQRPLPITPDINDPRYYRLRGKYVVIEYQYVKTMTISYLALEPRNPPATWKTRIAQFCKSRWCWVAVAIVGIAGASFLFWRLTR